MSAEVVALAEHQGKAARPDPVAAAKELAALLDLPSVGLTIRGGRIVGHGSEATADIYLSDGSAITFRSLRQIGTAALLALEVVSCTGANPNLKAPQARRAVALLRALAEHQAAASTDELSVEWGTGYLQAAPVLAIDVNDQAQRWRAFSELDRIDPFARSRQDGMSIAAASLVLRHEDGTRLVRCGWFRAHARQDDPTASPQEIANRMQRVGWQRRNKSGRIKATRPGNVGSLVWTFYSVPANWEDDQ